MTRIEHIIASIRGTKKNTLSDREDLIEPESKADPSPPKKGLSKYFSKRSPEDIESDRLELIKQNEAKQAKHDFEQEQKNERIRQHQPSRFEEDISKVKK